MALPTFAQNLKDVMRVLLIGQNGATPASVKAMLIKEKFVCDTADLSLDGLEIGSLDYDVVLLDLSTRSAKVTMCCGGCAATHMSGHRS